MVPLQDEVRLKSSSSWSENKIHIICMSFVKFMNPLENLTGVGFLFVLSEDKNRIFPTSSIFCFYIPEVNEYSEIIHVLYV